MALRQLLSLKTGTLRCRQSANPRGDIRSRGMGSFTAAEVAVNYENFAGQSDLTQEERIVSVEGYRLNLVTCVIFVCLSFLSGGLIPLLGRWFPLRRFHFLYTPCPIGVASHVLISTAAGEHDFSPLRRAPFSPAALRALPENCVLAAVTERKSSSSDSSRKSRSSNDDSSIRSNCSSRRSSAASNRSNGSTHAQLPSSSNSNGSGAAASDSFAFYKEASTSSILTRSAADLTTAAATEAGEEATAPPQGTEAAPANEFVVANDTCGCGGCKEGEALLFEYRHIRYVLKESEGEMFHPVCFDVSLCPPLLLHAVQEHAACPCLLQQRQKLYGRCGLRVECPSLVSLFAAEVLQPFYLCQIGAILLWLADDYYCYATVIAVITVAATVSDVLGTRKQKLRLKKATEAVCTVEVLRRRSCSRSICSSSSSSSGNCLERRVISSDELTNGDLLLLQPGIRVPCDLLLLQGTVVLDERSLTGECFPVLKSSLPLIHKTNKRISLEQESRHMVFAGTVVLSSTGSAEAESFGEGCSSFALGVVCRVGFATAQGGTVRSLLFPSPLRMDFDRESLCFLFCLAGITVVVASYTAIFFYFRGVSLRLSFLRIADLFTDALPPALRATLSVSLTAAASRMLSLYSISSLSPRRINICGFVRCVCLDKTGTLTEDGVSLLGCLPACHCSGSRSSGTSGKGFKAEEQEEVTAYLADSLVSPAVLGSRNHQCYSCRVHLLHCMSCCSSLASVGGRVAGDPLEASLLAASGWRLLDAAAAADAAAADAAAADALSEREGLSPAEEYEMLQQRLGDAATGEATFFLPQQRAGDTEKHTTDVEACICVVRRYLFCSVAMRMSVIAINLNSKQTQIYSKGSPESLLPLCVGETIPQGTEKRITDFAAAGYRVLVAAWRPLDEGENWQTLHRRRAERGLRFLGLFVFENKLKGDAKETISALRDAQIDIRILTGDSPHTAIGVAAECGILDSKEENSSSSSCSCCCCSAAAAAAASRKKETVLTVDGDEDFSTELQHQHAQQEPVQQQQQEQQPVEHQREEGEHWHVSPTQRALILGEVCSRHEESVGRREFLVWSLLLLPQRSEGQQQQQQDDEDTAAGVQPLLSLDIRELLSALPDARQAILVLTGRAFRHVSRLHVLLGLPFAERCEEIVQQVFAKHHTVHAMHPHQQQHEHQQQQLEMHSAAVSPDVAPMTSLLLMHPPSASAATELQPLLHTDDQQLKSSAHVERLRGVVEELLFQTPLLQPPQQQQQQQEEEIISLDREPADGGLRLHPPQQRQQALRVSVCSSVTGADALWSSQDIELMQQQLLLDQEDEELLQQEAAEAVQQHLGELQQQHPGELLLPEEAARASLSRVDRIQELLHQSECHRAEATEAAAAAAATAAGNQEFPGGSLGVPAALAEGPPRPLFWLMRFFSRHMIMRVAPSSPSPARSPRVVSASAVAPQYSSRSSSNNQGWFLRSLGTAACRLGLTRNSPTPRFEPLQEPLLHPHLQQQLPPPQHTSQQQQHTPQQPQQTLHLKHPRGTPFAAGGLDALMHQENCVQALGGMVLTLSVRRCCCCCCCCTSTSAAESSDNCRYQQHLRQQQTRKSGNCIGGNNKQIKMSLYEFVLRRTALLCRANPQDKGDFVSALQQLPCSPFVAMTGDGTNDLLAIKRADMGVSLSSDGVPSAWPASGPPSAGGSPENGGLQGAPGASLASSFTIGKLSSCVALLREARCVLQNSVSTVLFITLYSIIELSSVVCLYHLEGNLSDSQYMWVDLLTIMPLSLFLSQTDAPKRLSTSVPPSSLFARPVLFSVIGQAVIQVSFQIVAFFLCTSHPSIRPAQPHTHLAGKENTAMFFVSAMQYLYVCAALGSSGLQWREGLLKNRRCLLYMCLLGGFCLSFLLFPPDPSSLSSLPHRTVTAAAAAKGGFLSLFFRLFSDIWGVLCLFREGLYSWLGLVPLSSRLQRQLLLLSACNGLLTVAYEVFAVRRELSVYLKKKEDGGGGASHIPKTKGACQVTLLLPAKQAAYPPVSPAAVASPRLSVSDGPTVSSGPCRPQPRQMAS